MPKLAGLILTLHCRLRKTTEAGVWTDEEAAALQALRAKAANKMAPDLITFFQSIQRILSPIVAQINKFTITTFPVKHLGHTRNYTQAGRFIGSPCYPKSSTAIVGLLIMREEMVR